MLTKLAAAAPLNGVGVAPVGEVTVELPLELLAVPLVSVKLAQVKRVVLLVWMTIERLPRKLPMPASVDA